MAQPDLNDPAFKPENEDPRRRPGRPRVLPTQTAERSEKLVKVVCTTELKPWVIIREEGKPDLERPLDIREIAMIPEWIADILVANEHAVRV